MLFETLNNGQREIFDRLVSGENIFITGNAGTGKSYLVKAFDEWCEHNKKNLVKTAPTGVAALEIGGATLHKQFGLKVGLDFDEVTEEGVVTDKKLNFLKRTDILLIDEISMVRIDIFDKLMKILYHYNESRKKKRKKPIQLVFVGDFYQLAPVVNKEERPHLEAHYKRPIGDGYAFQSRHWKEFGVRLCNLTEVVRQADPDFCAALDECKEGDTHCLQFIRAKSCPDVIEDAIWLCGKNATAKEKNDIELAKINAEKRCFDVKYDGDASAKDKLCDEQFYCKVGARVVFLINDPLGQYQNGSMGTVVKILTDSLLVKVDDRKDFNGELVTGNLVAVEPHAFCKYKYESKTTEILLFEEDENGNRVPVIDEKTGLQKKKREIKLAQVETGRAEQIPLRLGYAVTIHKSQGQTYEKMNLMPEIFATGQLYVALSRCKSIENMHIEGYISNRMVMSSNEVIAFYNNPEAYSFFGDGIATIQIPERYKEKILALIAEWENDDSKQAEEQPAPALTFKRQWGRGIQTEAQRCESVEAEKRFAQARREQESKASFEQLDSLKVGEQLSLFPAVGE